MSIRWKRLLAESTRTWRRLNQMKQHVNSEIGDVDTQTSDNQNTRKRSGMPTLRKAGEQLDMISAPSTGWMSSVPITAPAGRMISVTARASAS
jgi:hypothetical protein